VAKVLQHINCQCSLGSTVQQTIVLLLQVQQWAVHAAYQAIFAKIILFLFLGASCCSAICFNASISHWQGDIGSNISSATEHNSTHTSLRFGICIVLLCMLTTRSKLATKAQSQAQCDFLLARVPHTSDHIKL
jgi:hypothetical protein